MRWFEAGYSPPKVGINVSARQISEGNFAKKLQDTLSDTEVPVSAIELEITETVLLHEREETEENLNAVRDMGLSIALDDFGTGFSSLSHLRRFPIDRVKIDRSFVRDIETDEDDRTLSSAIISLAHKLGIEVVAAGVETESQAEFLTEQGCDELQGYLFGKPIPPEDYVRYLKRAKTGD